VVGLDVNYDVRNCKFMERMSQLGLVELVTAQHGVEGLSMYNRGSQPLDGLFVSRTLRGLRCGYDEFIWDHRLLWLEIPLSIAFGHNVPPIVRPKARRLKCEDPRIVRKYLAEYHSWVEHYDLVGKARWIQENAWWLQGLVQGEYDKLDEFRYEAMMVADKWCQKLSMGDNRGLRIIRWRGRW